MQTRPASILVVDDEALLEYVILQKFRRQIKDEQYSFLFAPNGAKALEKIHAGLPVDMILTDIRMPEMDGLTLLERLREIDDEIKAVVISAYGDMKNIRAAMNRGAFDFLTKPLDLHDLDATIRKTLEHVEKVRTRQEQLSRVQEQLRYFAFHDALTNLANRAWFTQLLEHAIGLNKRNLDYPYTLMFLDLDRFKVINDSLGHSIGDQLLQTVATRIQRCLRTSDTVARLGGDEFAILIENSKDIYEAIQVAQRIQAGLAMPYEIGERQFHLNASIGITTSDVGYSSAEHALRDADVAMYRAKRQAEGYAIFDPSMQVMIAERLQIEGDLRRALEQQEFQNYYQPIVSLTSGSVLGFEVLVRWKNGEQGWVSPAKLISVAEETGLIHALGRQIFRAACLQLREWQEAFPDRPLQLNINISAIQLKDLQFARQVQEILEEVGVSADRFKLELTESALLDDFPVHSRQLFQLLDLHMKLCVDDFGTGYSSLSRLHDFPIHTLKIDRSFIRRMNTSSKHYATVQIIIALAHMLEMDVVAEGIEDAEEQATLMLLGCELGQGYHLSPPLSAVDATAFLESRP